MKRPAVFLDRDGTLIDDVGYLADPEGVRLRPGAAETVRRLREAGFVVIVVSNQSGVARGKFSEEQMWLVHERLEEMLAESEAHIDDALYCPHLGGSEAVVKEFRIQCDCRKPQPGLLLRAATRHNLDLTRSWMIGDADRDVQAGRAAQCRTVLLDDGAPAKDGHAADHVVTSLLEAVEIVERAMKQDIAEGRSTRTVEDDATTKRDDTSVRLLTEIRDRLDRADRRERQHDFSVLRLFGALLQMFAIVAAVTGLLAMLNDGDTAATARFALAAFLQLAALTAFGMDRFR
jgi:D-glycero-D-manno-heptose 1,7-bisphosphate phosphatase